jgi:mannose-6-phosphate isomerase-like protein (cupin superfamily)
MDAAGGAARLAAMPEPDISLTRLDRDVEARFQTLRRELGVRSFGLNLIVLLPRQRGRIHAHEQQEEVYLVLEGRLTVLVEDVAHVLGPDELMRVGPAVRRQLVNAGDERVVVLALGGSGEHAGRDGLAWPSWAAGPPSAPQDLPLPDDLPA